MRRPPTSADIERLKEKSVGSEFAHDVAWLAEEIDRLAGQVSDCWLLLDSIARASPAGIEQELTAALLRKQKAPGWK